jgi:hypothetical protein
LAQGLQPGALANLFGQGAFDLWTFSGGQVTSNEIAGLTLFGGRFRSNSPRNDASMEDMFMNGKAAFTSDRFNFGGGEYSFNDKRTQVGLWYAELTDIYQQQYANLTHSQPVGDWTLNYHR